jgi:hypothetical protein
MQNAETKIRVKPSKMLQSSNLFGAQLIKKISVLEEIYNRINSENECYSSAQIFLFPFVICS